MNEIIDSIFTNHFFERQELQQNLILFYRKDRMREYFIVQFIDAVQDISILKSELFTVEENFISHNNVTKNDSDPSIRNKIIDLLPKELVPALDKNLSLIICTKVGTLSDLKEYKNLIYAVEESPRYFQKYVLPYTENQTMPLKEKIENGSSIKENLNAIINATKGYEELLKTEYSDDLYSLVVRIFSKNPIFKI